jgi:hypothetical protein
MSHQAPDIDSWTYKPSDTPGLYDLSVSWSIPGPDSPIPGDSPDHFRVLFDGRLYKDDVAASETQLDIPSVAAGLHTVQVCCEWPATAEATADEKCTSVGTAIVPGPPPAPKDPPIPTLAVVSRLPRRLNQRNQITISWASFNFNDGDIYWGQVGQVLNRHQSIKPKSDRDYSGRYTTDVETFYGVSYQFHVQVKNSFVSNTWRSSDLIVRAIDNFRSAKAFLQASGLPGGQSLRYVCGAAKTTSLREVMGFGHTIA